MIVLPGDLGSDSKKSEQKSRVPVQPQQEISNDPPPSYSALPVPQPASISAQHPFPDIRPSNFVYLSRANSKIRGSWVVDPALVIPRSFLPPLWIGETELSRKNLSLDSANGGIDADIFVLPTNDVVLTEQLRRRVLIRLSSTNGAIVTRIHDNGTRLPLEISACTTNSHIKFYLPRSFNGPLRINQTNGRLRYSNAVGAMLTTFSEVQGAHYSFLGPLDTSNLDLGANWEGDALKVESRNANVSIYFDDEADQRSPPLAPPKRFSNLWPFN